MEIPKLLSKYIREIMKEKKITSKAISEKLNCNAVSYSRLLAKGITRINTLYEICNAIGFDVAIVFRDKDNQENIKELLLTNNGKDNETKPTTKNEEDEIMKKYEPNKTYEELKNSGGSEFRLDKDGATLKISLNQRLADQIDISKYDADYDISFAVIDGVIYLCFWFGYGTGERDWGTLLCVSFMEESELKLPKLDDNGLGIEFILYDDETGKVFVSRELVMKHNRAEKLLNKATEIFNSDATYTGIWEKYSEQKSLPELSILQEAIGFFNNAE